MSQQISETNLNNTACRELADEIKALRSAAKENLAGIPCSDTDMNTILDLLVFLFNRQRTGLQTAYGLAVRSDEDVLEKRFLETLDKLILKLLPAYQIYHLAADDFERLGAEPLESEAALISKFSSLGTGSAAHSIPILVIAGWNSSCNKEHLLNALNASPTIKILCASKRSIQDLYDYNGQFYTVFPRMITLLGLGSAEITEQFLKRFRTQYPNPDQSFIDGITYYIDTVYDGNTRFRDEEFISDLLERRIPLLMNENLGVDSYRNGASVGKEMVPSSLRVVERKKQDYASPAAVSEISLSQVNALLPADPQKPVFPQNAPHTDHYNVLLVALSTFPPAGMSCSRYTFIQDENELSGYYFYQLMPVVQITSKRLHAQHASIDKILILYTDKTEKEMPNVRFTGIPEKDGEVYVIPEKISPLRLFKTQAMEWVNPKIREEDLFETVNIKEYDPSNGVKDAVEKLREFKKQHPELRLHISTHGGFRGIQLIMEAILSLMKGSIRMQDIYTVQFTDNVSRVTNNPAEFRIFDFVAGMNEFLNYGRIDSLENYLADRETGLLQPMRMISEGIQMCSIFDFEEGLKALKQYFEDNEDINDDYLQLFRGTIRQDYGDLVQDITPFNELKWCLKKGLYQQALTIIESNISSELLEKGIMQLGSQIHKEEDSNKYTYSGLQAFTLNQLFNGCLFDGSGSIRIIQPNYFNAMGFNDTSGLENYLCVKFHKHSLDSAFLAEKIDILSSASMRTSNAYDVNIDHAVSYYGNSKTLFLLLFLHKTMKDVRNKVNHGDSSGKYSLDKVVKAMRLYVSLLDAVEAEAAGTSGEEPSQTEAATPAEAIRVFVKTVSTKKVHLEVPGVDPNIHCILAERKNPMDHYHTGDELWVTMIDSSPQKQNYKEV